MQTFPFASLSICLADPQQLLNIKTWLKEQYTLAELPVTRCHRVFFDSFDWRIYRQNLLCFTEDGSLHLTDFLGKAAVPSLPLQEEMPPFWRELPETESRQKLASILQNRAMLPQGIFSSTVTPLHFFDTKGKITISAFLLEIAQSWLLELRSVQSREKQFLHLARRIEAQFGAASPCPLKLQLEAALAAAGRQPLDYSSAFSVTLKPNMDCRAAVKVICHSLLTTMQRNEHGVIEDIDSEFLHDFRVAVRRTRSVLTLLRDALEPEAASRFKAEFRELCRHTGPVRDLDVQLLTAEDCRARLPEVLHDGLVNFFDGLSKKRDELQQELVFSLAAPQHQERIRAWQEYLDIDSTNSGKSIGKAAKKIIRKQFDRLLRASQAIDGSSSDRELHQVRIQGKKLRYSLEFFRSLLPEQKLDYLIVPLKQLHDSLGMYNDLSVQEKMLEQFLSALKPGTAKTKKTAAAVGGLLTSFRHSREQLRPSLLEAFRQFRSEKNAKQYKRLFKK